MTEVKMKIFYTAPFDLKYLQLIEKNLGEIIPGIPEEEVLLDEYAFQDVLKETQPEILIVEINKVTAKVITAAPALRAIAVCRSGINNIDVGAATERNILVINTPGRNAVAVAELTVAGMISIARNLVKGVNLIRNRGWEDMVKTCYALEGIELGGRTAGIIGLGEIGKRLAKRLKAFEMELLGYDPYVKQNQLDELGINLVSLDELMRKSDFVILLASVTEESRGMIDSTLLSLMKPDAYFVNMARSALVMEAALLETLQEKRIAGAVLDVHSAEPLPFDSPWLSLDNVLLTPHIGGATKEMITNHSRMVYEDLLLFARGERPCHIVNPQVLENYNYNAS
jgi:D-3-phosphoglycerate dehydrogenase